MKLVVAMVLAAACSSNEYKEGALGLKWKPPQGVKLDTEGKDGAVVTAHFSGGVNIYRVDAPALPTSGDLDALKTAILGASKARADGEVKSAKDGTIPSGPVVRWETVGHDEHTLLYYVPARDHYFVLTLTTKEQAFDRRSEKFELSLSSLKP
jgi:hypothetical protein